MLRLSRELFQIAINLDDPDGPEHPATRRELTDLLERATGGSDEAAADLDDRFSGPLEFGTAGLRGE